MIILNAFELLVQPSIILAKYFVHMNSIAHIELLIVNLVKIVHGRPVVTIHSDYGEFNSNSFKEMCRRNGIQYELAPP